MLSLPRPLARRIAGHALALAVAAVLGWLVFRGYRQPELILELANLRLC